VGDLDERPEPRPRRGATARGRHRVGEHLPRERGAGALRRRAAFRVWSRARQRGAGRVPTDQKRDDRPVGQHGRPVHAVTDGGSEEGMRPHDGPVALVGLGNMGAAVAGRLAARFKVLAFDLDPMRRSEAATRYGIDVVVDLAPLARASTLVLSLPAPAISATVVQTLLPDLRPGALIVETSTVNPADMWRLRDLCSSAGVRVVDGAILSGVAQMAAGRSTLLVGGKAEDLDAAAGLFAALAPRVLRFGDVGSGMAANAINHPLAPPVLLLPPH